MGKFRVKIEKLAEQDLKLHLKSGNTTTLKKIEKILVELSLHPYSGSGQPEKLRHDLNGFWSRIINQKDRIVYEIEEEIVTIFVISAKGHYSDK